jgi:peptide alpha-N-acetyltransferase
MQQLAANRIETHLMGFEIYIRKSKFLLLLLFLCAPLPFRVSSLTSSNFSLFATDKLLLALKSLLKSVKIDKSNATLHEQLDRFALAVQTAGETLKPAVKTVIDQHWETLYQGHQGRDIKALSGFTGAFLETSKGQGSVPGLIAAAIAVSLIEPGASGKTKAEEILFLMAGADENKYKRTRSLENCLLAKKTLKNVKSSRVKEFSTKAQEWFPTAKALQS